MVAVALPLASSALGSTAGASILPSILGASGATAGASGLGSSFLSKLGGGGMGGFFSGFGNSITGLPVMQAFGQDPSPMGSFGQLLGGGLLGGDFSNAGQAYMLGGGMGGLPMMGQQVIGQGGGQYQPTPGMNMGGQISDAEAQRMLAEMMQQPQYNTNFGNMMSPLDTFSNPSGLLASRQIGI